MKARGKLTCLVLAVVMIVSGVLAPVSASAQSQSGQPDMYQEALKGAPAKPSKHDGAYEAGAAVANVFYVPGKVILCALGVNVGFALMFLTFGTAYRQAKSVAEEGCGGGWTVTAEDMEAANAHRGVKEDSYLR